MYYACLNWPLETYSGGNCIKTLCPVFSPRKLLPFIRRDRGKSALHLSTTRTIAHLRNGATEVINNIDSQCNRIVRNEKYWSFGVRKQSERWAKLLQTNFRTILTNPVTRPTLYIQNTLIIQETARLFRALFERNMGKACLRLTTGTWENLVTYLLLRLPVFMTFSSTTPHECQIQLVSFLQSYTYSLVRNYITRNGCY